MTQFTTDNIDSLAAVPLGWPGGWLVTFQSSNAGMCHQLYINGCLASWTDTQQERSFVLDAANCPRQIVVAAVEPASASRDFSSLLPAEAARPSWVYRRQIVRSRQLPPGSRVEFLDDHATGQLDDKPLASVEVWPEWGPAWSDGPWDGYGFGGVGGTDSGSGAFGSGPFGVDQGVVVLQASLKEDGLHRVALRAVLPDGSVSPLVEDSVEVTLPPPPPQSIDILGYDIPTSTLTLQIQ